MKYQAIIFDLDGTIVDTEVIWEAAMHKLITARQKFPTAEQKEHLLSTIAGADLRTSCLIIKNFFNLPDPLEQLVAEKSQYAFDLYRQGVSFVKGFTEFHQQAQSLNLKMSIATNSNSESLEIVKQQLKLESFFGKHIYCIAHVNNIQKPNPAVYLHAAEKIQVKPEHCIAIEDSAYGITAAKAAGMFCYGINTSGKPKQLQHADLIINNYFEINLLEKLGIK